MTDITTIINSNIAPILDRYSDKTGFRYDLNEFTDNVPDPGSDRFFSLTIVFEAFSSLLEKGYKAIHKFNFVVTEAGAFEFTGAPANASFEAIDQLKAAISLHDPITRENGIDISAIRFYGAAASSDVACLEMEKLIDAGIPFDLYSYSTTQPPKKVTGNGRYSHSKYRQRKNGTWKKVA